MNELTTQEFFETIFGDAEGFLFFGWRDSEGNLNQQKFVKYPESAGTIPKFVEGFKDEDLYFSPMLYTIPRRKKTTVCATPTVYADTDLFNPDDYLVAPTLNVQTSEGRTHSYWVLDRGDYQKEDVSRVARAISVAHDVRDKAGNKVGVDPSGWDLTQLLRVPGTMNTKTEPGFPVSVRNSSGAVYSLDHLADVYDPENVSAVEIHVASSMPTTIPDPKPILVRIANITKLMNLYSKEPTQDQDWSDTLYLFVSEMLREGFTPAEVLSVGWNAACNKYRRDGRPKEHFWEYDITRAIKDPANRPRTRVEDEAPDDGESVKASVRITGEGVAKEVEDLILTPEEVQNLPETFVDDYVKWAEEKTDAPRPYHVAGALTILSLVLGEWAVGDVKYGAQRLGMFFTVLGETTDTRKTTSRNLMKRLLRLCEVGDYNYILTSDTTEESLIDALSERGHQSSLYDRDEVQKLVLDIKGGKGYMGGFFETLNELYDGTARGRLRSTKQTRDTPVNFAQYLMGIRSQFQENLELQDFKSGWGPRNVFVRGESPPRTRENSRLTQGGGAKQADWGLQRLAKKLTDARDFWSAKQQHNRENPYRMRFEEEAWIRQTDWEWDLKDRFKDHPRFEYLKPSLERMSINVMKVAILFAMMERRDEVEMSDVLNAHYISCQWVEDLIVIIEGVSESFELRHMRAVENYLLEKGGLLTVAQTLSWATNKGMKRREFYEAVETLQDMEVIEIVKDSRDRKCIKHVIND